MRGASSFVGSCDNVWFLGTGQRWPLAVRDGGPGGEGKEPGRGETCVGK